MDILIKFIRWIFAKFAAIGLIVGLSLAACGLWFFLKDNVDFDEWRSDLIRAINGERSKVQAAKSDVLQRMDRIALEISIQRERATQTDRVIAQLREEESAWERFAGNREQQKTNAERLKSMLALRQSLTTKLQELQTAFTRATWERDGLDLALGKLEVRLAETQAQQSRAMYYLEKTWNQPVGRGPVVLPLKWWIAVVLGVYLLGPSVAKCLLYFGVAPFIERGRPVRLDQNSAGIPEVADSSIAATLSLQAGEKLLVKEKFLQASDEGLAKKSRAFLDWKIPFTCFATGLVELVELTNSTGKVDSEKLLTLSNQGDALSELAVVTLPPGASLVLRPRFLAGVVLPPGERLRIRRRWQFFRWQAWVSLQFRFFEFVGPARLVVAGNRGVRVERLFPRSGGELPARRVNQDATMAFTPGLDYRPARAETFWGYYRSMNPLFDDLFSGQGIFLCQQVASEGDAKAARNFWSSVGQGLLKVFGI